VARAPDGFHDVLVQCVALGKGLVERDFADVRPHGGLRQLCDREQRVLHAVAGLLRIHDLYGMTSASAPVPQQILLITATLPEVASSLGCAPAHLDIQDAIDVDGHVVLGDGALVRDRDGNLLQAVYVCYPVHLQIGDRCQTTTHGRRHPQCSDAACQRMQSDGQQGGDHRSSCGPRG
jgi:hypothetical protein